MVLGRKLLPCMLKVCGRSSQESMSIAGLSTLLSGRLQAVNSLINLETCPPNPHVLTEHVNLPNLEMANF
jgi:hypothetical protein